MKASLIILTILFLPAILFGQQNRFKNKTKNKTGSYIPSFHINQNNQSNNLKSSSVAKYNQMNPLALSGLKKTSNLIKKIVDANSIVFLETESANLKSANFINPEERFYSFFEKTNNVTGLSTPRESLQINSIETDPQGMIHIRSTQLHKGIELYGSESTTHFSHDKERFTGKLYMIDETLNTTPAISSNVALKLASENLNKITLVKELSKSEKELLHYDQTEIRLVYFKDKENPFKLCWAIETRPNFIEVWKYFIDAQTGEIIRKFNATNFDGPATANAYDLNNQLRSINTYLENGQYLLADLSQPMYNSAKNEGMIITFDANNTSSKNLNYKIITSSNNTWNNAKAVSAHANTIKTYEYLLNTYGRNSMNNQGGNILSFINISNDDGTSMANAFWNGQAAFYGNGGDEFKPLAGAQDVISHELGHGVISNTANLEYYGQSGAINESYADIFGSMVDRDDWLIGEDVTKTSSFPSGALRNMADPHNSGTSANYWWQPKHTSEMYLGENDNAGVHTNSGIGNYAYYLFATAISKNKAEQVFYRALSFYLTKSSQFIDLRIAVIQAAKDLYGDSSPEVNAAKSAFDAVGIYDEVQIDPDQEYETNNGEEFILSYYTGLLSFSTLYRTNANGENFVGLTGSTLKAKPSVTDDGVYAVYVTDDDKLKAVVIDPDNPEEFIVSDEAFWDNVAISKDGNRLAAISNEVDASIYVYDFIQELWMKFQLYNPTTSDDNIEAGGVLYADAIEFDVSGEYLIYDAYNELSSTTSENINYWDIGFIKVWDNATNNFGDGTISKLYGSLPENVSIGNPVFSKNSPNIIAFDYFDESSEEYAIIGADLLTGDIDVIFSNTTLGYPSFSPKDDKIAFSAMSDLGNEVVGVIGLSENKISPLNDAVLLIDNAKWPVYYATGTRTLGLAPVANFTADYKQGNSPFEVQFIDASLNEPTAWNWSFPGGTPSSSTQQNPVITYYNNGSFQVSLKAINNFGNNSSIKTNYISVGQTDNSQVDEKVKLRIYPNPIQDKIIFVYDGNATITICDLNGKVIFKESNPHMADLNGYTSGVYIIEFNNGETILKNKILKR